MKNNIEEDIFMCNLCKKTYYGKFGSCFHIDGKPRVFCKECSKKVENISRLPEVMIVPITHISFQFVKKNRIYFHPSDYGRKGGRYIAFYIAQPISAITHIAKVSNIVIEDGPVKLLKEINFDKDIKSIKVYYLKDLKKLKNPIKRGNSKATIQGTTNSTLEKIKNSKDLKDLLLR
jgi:hypothetical protein